MIEPSIIGDTKIISILDELPQTFYDAVKDAVTELGEELLARARANAPIGKTGRLKAGNVLTIKKGKDFIKAKVANTEGAKAVAIEYGATGRSKTAVRAHTMKLAHAWARVISPITVSIPEFNRIQNIPAHPFMRPALASIQEEAIERLRAATDDAAARATAEMAA